MPNLKKNGIYLLLPLMLAACNSDKSAAPNAAGPAGGQAPTVVVQIAKPQDVLIQTQLPGRVVASQTADVRPQVSGIILKRLFEEGSKIEEEAPLYQIDPDVYEAALKQAQANLSSAQSAEENAKIKANRISNLSKTDAISKQDLDNALTALKQAQANVLASKAMVKNAQINLDYTTIKAPISGRIGKSNVTAGALVTANQATALATIQTLDPINVDITFAANNYANLRDKIISKKMKTDVNNIDVHITLDNGQPYEHTGKLSFSDLNVNQTTSSILLQAAFKNPQNILLSGMFIRATVDQGTVENAFLVPQKVVSHAPTGDFMLWIINKDNIAEPRMVKVEGVKDNQWIVTEGLVDGDKIVIEGSLIIQNAARTGQPAKVTPITAEEKAAAEKAAKSASEKK